MIRKFLAAAVLLTAVAAPAVAHAGTETDGRKLGMTVTVDGSRWAAEPVQDRQDGVAWK
jgi:hypothetical protein